MLRTKVDPQPTLWESLLPEEFRRLPPGLSAIDAFLDDPVFFEPFVAYFDPRFGRPSIPIETYLRLMHLRFRYDMGFESLCAEVTDSLSWRRFCRIGPYDKVPDPSTLMKITRRCGSDVVAQLNEALLNKANAAHLVKLDKLRADTTVVPANVAYPTDSGLLAKGVAKLARSVSLLKSLGFATRTSFRDRTRSVRRRAHSIGAWLRRRNDEAKEEVLKITGELAGIAEASIVDALDVAHNARRKLARAGTSASGRPPLSLRSSRPPSFYRRSSPRHAHGSQVRSRTGREGSSRCTTPTPARSPKAGSANLWNSGTKLRSPTTSTASCSTWPCSRATRPTPRCSCRRSPASRRSSAVGRKRSRPTAATARRASRQGSRISG